MTDSSLPGDGKSGAESWIEQTTEGERLQSVFKTLDQPRPVDYIAEEAHASENRVLAYAAANGEWSQLAE